MECCALVCTGTGTGLSLTRWYLLDYPGCTATAVNVVWSATAKAVYSRLLSRIFFMFILLQCRWSNHFSTATKKQTNEKRKAESKQKRSHFFSSSLNMSCAFINLRRTIFAFLRFVPHDHQKCILNVRRFRKLALPSKKYHF